MRSTRTISLFNERPDLSQSPSPFVASILVHCAVLGLLSFGVLYTPPIEIGHRAVRYAVRHLDLETAEQRMRRSAMSKVAYPGPRPAAQAGLAGGKPATQPPSLRQTALGERGPQTLVQPDLPSHLKLAREIPAPTVVIWSPPKTPVKDIVAPLPAKPTAADVTPSLDRPNEEVNLADVSIASAALASLNPQVLPSTTSPVTVHGPDRAQLPPTTVSQPNAQPTPASVLSLSDLRMARGTATLPPVNETASSNSPGELTPGKARDAATPGSGNPAGNAGGAGAGNSADKTARPAASAKAAGTRDEARSWAQWSADGSGTGNRPTASRITLPKDGQFGAVVVGASLEDQFPDMVKVWSGRLAYTVYLHVGLAKSWILQYSLPRSAEAAAAGNIAHLEAPWPYNIVRPNLAPGSIGADALMIHGYVNQTGHFEMLDVVFPPDFTQAQFVLNALDQWQFRPAAENGQATKVEVLLIIPDME